MPLIVADRIMESSVTTGTGAFTLAGAYTAYRAFSAVCATNDTAYYVIEAIDANGNATGDWEAGLGTYSGANTLTRTTVLASSNAGAAVNFAAGTKRVRLEAIAAYLAAFLTSVPFAVAGDINTGTDTTKALNSDALAGSNTGKRLVEILVTDPTGSALTVADGQAYYRVPSALNGMNLVEVAAAVTTASSSGLPTIQLANVTDAVDMLSTKLTIDANETDSKDATTASVIDTTKDDVATGDMLRVDVDVAGTGTKGLIVCLAFQLP